MGGARVGYTAQVTKPGVLVLLALLAAPPLLALLLYDVGAIRVAGLSFEWWYVGMIAPLLAVVSPSPSPDAAVFAPTGMTDAVRLLAVWLTPALWLAMPAIILARGPEGLWIALTLTAAPLVALVMNGRAGLARTDGRWIFRRVVLFAVAGIMIWANVVIAGDVAEWLGAPRWHAIGVAVLVAWLATAWRGAGRGLIALWLAGLIGLGVPLVELVRHAGIDPLAAWERVATQTGFRFPASSVWVTSGRTFGASGGRASVVFTEEHSVTAPSGGLLRGHSAAAARGSDQEWRLSPGQSVTLRTGDRLEAPTAIPLRFEAGKRVPGAPPSGMAWAAWSPVDGWRALGLGLTLVMGAVALLRAGPAVRVSRREALVVGAGLLLAFAWAQGWAIYRVLDAPDLFLGGVTIERLADFGGFGHGLPRWTVALQTLVVGAGAASFIASNVALGAQVPMPRGGGVPQPLESAPSGRR